MLVLSTSLASAILPSCTHSPWYTYSSFISQCHQNLQRQRRKRLSGMTRRQPLLSSSFIKKQTGLGIPVILVHHSMLLPITSGIIVLWALRRQENSARRSGQQWVLDHSNQWWSSWFLVTSWRWSGVLQIGSHPVQVQAVATAHRPASMQRLQRSSVSSMTLLQVIR